MGLASYAAMALPILGKTCVGVGFVDGVAVGFDDFGSASAQFGLVTVALLGKLVEAGHAAVDGIGDEADGGEAVFEVAQSSDSALEGFTF